MPAPLSRAIAALRDLWTREPTILIAVLVAAVVFAAAKVGVVLDPLSLEHSLELLLPILLGGAATRTLVTPAKAPSPWLPIGKTKIGGLTISRRRLPDAGTFTGGGHKIVWHTTEGGSFASVLDTLKAKDAGVHFVIDPKSGRVAQCIPLNRAARGLQHTLGPETNRANAIQIEIVGYAADSGEWTTAEYKHLAALAALISDRFKVPLHARSFYRPERFTGDEFVAFAGHCGHVHVPGNSHTDPGTGFNWPKLLTYIKAGD